MFFFATKSTAALALLPCDVRWGSHHSSVEYCTKHWSSLVEIVATLQRPGELVRRDIENLGVRRAAEDMVLQLHPVAVALDNMQSSGMRFTSGSHCWSASQRTSSAAGGKKCVNVLVCVWIIPLLSQGVWVLKKSRGGR